jgi:Domain of unknown function (DUF1924)
MKKLLIPLLLSLSLPAFATENAILESYRSIAQQENVGFKGFSAARGQAFYNAKSGDLSCASCHTDSPKGQGKHATTGKDILPLAPSANAERLSDPAKLEKWFKRNCNEVLKRTCTAQEKGDFMTYLLSIK